MKQTIIKNEKLQEQYYLYQHETGLTIALYPMQGYSSTFALFGTKLGSIDNAFKTCETDEYTVVPEGIAHFLEHKLFESEEGDAFSLFAETGASANAYTSFDRTCYLFSATAKFEQSLQSLLKFVQEPYFTQETVEKEQGIIGQEIRMYDDDAGWRVFFNLLGALYHNHPVRIDIAGTTDSIAKIDADLLYQCYHTFYNLNNMILSIAGNFELEPTLALINGALKDTEPVTVYPQPVDEPRAVASDKVEQKLAVSMPLFDIGYKEEPLAGLDSLKRQLEFEVLLEILAGESSSLYQELYESGLITPSFGAEIFNGRGYFAVLFSGESKDPMAVKARVQQEIERFRQTGVDKDAFDRTKKALYGRLVRGLNNVEGVANGMIAYHFADVNLFDSTTLMEAMTVQAVNALLQDSMKAEYSAISIINPSDK